MRILIICLCCVALLLAGCGKRLSGRYESAMAGPMLMPDLSAEPQANLAPPMPAMPGMNKMTLEFDGAKVRMGTAGDSHEYNYRIQDSRLELIPEGTGQDVPIAMKLEADGTITYQMFSFRKVN